MSTSSLANFTIQKLERERNEAREQIQMMLKHDANRLESDSIVGSCDCLTKTPEVKYHKPGCKYRLISQRDETCEQLEVMREAINEAHGALETCKVTGPLASEGKWASDHYKFDRLKVKAALAKLQPFLKP